MEQHASPTGLPTELIFLGTGCAMVTKCFNTCFALKNGEDVFLVDAGGGNGILRQLEKAGIDIRQIHNLFVTHAHTDHILGVIWLVRFVAQEMNKERYRGKFRIFCHDVTADLLREFVEKLLPQKLGRHLGERILIVTLPDGAQMTCSHMDFTFFDIHSTKAKQYGFTAILPDHKKLVCLGDEPLCDANRPLAANADWLLTEAFCLDADRAVFKPAEKHHSTARDAGINAAALNAKNLVIYHTVDNDLKNRRSRYTAEASQSFHGRIVVPDDLDRILL
jgi:ribonuclease Z